MLETEHTTLLIDAGLGRKEILRRFEALGRQEPERVDGILITHEHSDHSTAAAQLARHWHCPTYLTKETHYKIGEMFPDSPEKSNPKAKFDSVEYIMAGRGFQIGDITIHPFVIPHDAADPVAFSFRADSKKVVVVTDLGQMINVVKEHVRGADFLMAESNHDVEKLKMGPYPWHIKLRIKDRRGHLSNEDLGEFLSDTDAFDGLARYLVLAHLSEVNNDPSLAQICAEQALAGRQAHLPFRGSLHTASQRVPLGPFEL